MKREVRSLRAATHFADSRDAALALLSLAVQRGDDLPFKTASFLGVCSGCSMITPKMRAWLIALLDKHAG